MRNLVILIVFVALASACWVFYQHMQKSGLEQAAQAMVDDFERAAEEVVRDREH